MRGAFTDPKCGGVGLHAGGELKLLFLCDRASPATRVGVYMNIKWYETVHVTVIGELPAPNTVPPVFLTNCNIVTCTSIMEVNK